MSPTCLSGASSSAADSLSLTTGACLRSGISFKCLDGQATVAADGDRIKAAIGEDATLLDETVHGINAASALRRALSEGGARRERFLEAVRKGHVRKLELCVTRSRSLAV